MCYNVFFLRWFFVFFRDVQVWVEKLLSNGELCYVSKEEWKCNGENVCCMLDYFDVFDVVKMWYLEIKIYDYDIFGFSIDMGYFIQIVW